MVVWHVCSLKRLNQYKQAGHIVAPVRAWENIQQAQRMSLSTGRPCILRLKFTGQENKLPGHFNQARVSQRNVRVTL